MGSFIFQGSSKFNHSLNSILPFQLEKLHKRAFLWSTLIVGYFYLGECVLKNDLSMKNEKRSYKRIKGARYSFQGIYFILFDCIQQFRSYLPLLHFYHLYLPKTLNFDKIHTIFFLIMKYPRPLLLEQCLLLHTSWLVHFFCWVY